MEMQSNLVAGASALAHEATLIDVLRYRAQVTPNRLAYIFLEDGESRELPLTYGELDRQARRVAARLQQGGLPSDHGRVLLVYPQGLEFLIAFVGSLYAGATAVLVYPPTSRKMAARLDAIASDCKVFAVLTTAALLDKTMAIAAAPAATAAQDGAPDRPRSHLASVPWICSDRLEPGLEANHVELEIDAGHVAFLQYTSGSTGTPKGVMVTHANLMANQRAIQDVYGSSAASVGVGWLPLIHDMGLIGNVLHPLFAGFPLVFMSPLHFMQRPVRWLRAISRYGATISGAPNFAYDLCAQKIAPEDLEGLDLSCWQVAFNGAEPVRAATIERFQRRFGCCGLDPRAHKAVYGLAEATLLVTGTRNGEPPLADAATGTMSSGTPQPCDDVKVVDPERCVELPEGAEGEVWVSGPSVAAGYWNRPEETRATFHATLAGSDRRYLRTGDTGYVRGGAVHITGRIKDMVIVRGRNYHAEDLEWSLNGVDGIRPGCHAMFSVDERGREELVLVAGVTSTEAGVLAGVLGKVRAAVYADHQLHVDRVVFIRPKELPMTTSGKVQRRATRDTLLQGGFDMLLDDRSATCEPGPGGAAAGRAPRVAPSTDAERALARTWSEVLGIPVADIGIDDNFFELGGSSLTMLDLAGRLDASMELLFRYPTIGSYLYRNAEYEFPDVGADIHLPPPAIDPALQGRTGIALVTGGTGFFGLHFLQAMLRRTQDRFVLPVRGASQQAIERKFDEAVAYFGMDDLDRSRITLVQGDIGQPRIGMSQEQYDWAVRHVDRIFHIGSHVNNWLPYEGIKQTNVEGTRHLLVLARTGRAKEFHYTSTSTFSPKKADKTVFDEGDRIDPADINRYFGYDLSKYVSEELCALARRDGTACSIYRLVWVGGHLASGLTKVGDGLNIMLRILLTLGCYPQGDYLHDVVPVDLMADSMASLQNRPCDNTDYNVTSQSKEAIDMKRIVAMLRGMGYRIDEVGRAEFVERLRAVPAQRWDEQCRSYRQLIIRLFEDPTPKIESYYDSANFRARIDPQVLERMEQKFVDVWFEKTVNYLVRQGALPTPDGRSYAEHMAQIARWNETAQPYPRQMCLHQLFEHQARATPDAPALRYHGEATSYLELDRQAERIARQLRHAGVAPRSMVGLSVHRSPAMIAAILGVFKAGCAYVPLDPTYPQASLDFMIDDCAAARILVDARSAPALAHHADRLLRVDDDAGADIEPTDAEVPLDCDAGDLAYVIYTSGTTGNPKGVMVEHRSVVNHNHALMQAFGLRAGDTMLQFSTVNFDSFIEEVFPTLFSGATLLMVDKETLLHVAQLQEAIRANGVTVLKMSTAFWHAIAELEVEALGVRLVGIGGEAADLHKYRAWRQRNPSIPLLNTYGPTEITVTATVAELRGDVERITIGKPIANTRLHVLDAQLNPVPVGNVGELYIGGAGVTRGYLRRPEITARAFIDNPFDADAGKLYKTGDLVRWTDDGELEFLGRCDSQVKVRGYRIELGAIEGLLAAQPDVTAAAVIVKEVDAKKKIVAYFSSDRADLPASTLRRALEERLPSYMLPNLIAQLPAIPLNPNGKVDRRHLEELELDLGSHGNHDVATPTTAAEIKMAGVWEGLLDITGIGLNDDFMDLGGHSLLAMSLVGEVNRQFGTDISMRTVYENPTVARLLAAVEGAGDGASTSNLVRFPEGRRSAAPASQTAPLFLVHGLGGHLASFYPLVKNLKRVLNERHQLDIEVYGLEANGFRDGQACFDSLDEMVAEYVRLIRATQPTGPYLLGGWSFGVSVAYQVAQELIRAGEVVETFISIDAEAPRVPKDFTDFIGTRAISNLDELYADDTLDELLGRFGRRFGFAANDGEPVKQQFQRFLGYSAGDPEDQRDRYSRVAIANLYNARGLQPEPIAPRHTVLVRASHSRFDNYHADWSELIGSKMLSSITLNGDHWSIMQDPELALHLARSVATTVPYAAAA